MTTKQIKWQSFKDHLDEILKKSKEISREIFNTDDDDDDDDDVKEDDGPAPYEDNYKGMKIEEFGPRLILPKTISRDLSISVGHECWIGHTNFDITEDVAEILNKCEGIELLRVAGRYTFIIGLGKYFDFAYVRTGINKRFKIRSKNEESCD